jgi:hypothetical protein
MSLPQLDIDYLAGRGFEYSVAPEKNMTCVVIKAYRLPASYDRAQSDLLIRLSPGYPDVAPDMWWFDPPARLSGRGRVKATDSTEHHLGRTWQRWSRHLQPGQWQSGIDSLESFLALIRQPTRLLRLLWEAFSSRQSCPHPW